MTWVSLRSGIASRAMWRIDHQPATHAAATKRNTSARRRTEKSTSQSIMAQPLHGGDWRRGLLRGGPLVAARGGAEVVLLVLDLQVQSGGLRLHRIDFHPADRVEDGVDGGRGGAKLQTAL